MKMLRCLNCGEVFTEDELVKGTGDAYEHFGFTGHTDSRCCPRCNDDDFEEVRICDCGHDYIADGETLCEECKEQIAIDFRRFCHNLSDAERDYLLDELLGDDDYVKKL
jgi:hypothetical protein